MDKPRLLNRVIYWCTKDGWGRFVGKLLATALTLLGFLDLVLGTHYLGIVIIVGAIVLVHLVFGFGALILKGLDELGLVNLSPEEEALRKGFGLVTGIDDWFEMIVDRIID